MKIFCSPSANHSLKLRKTKSIQKTHTQKMKRTEWKCKFEDIPPDCYEDVLVWNCSEKLLTSLPREIGYLTNLEILNCSGNELTSLPREIGYLTNLRRLSVEGDRMSYKTTEAVRKFIRRNKEGDPRDVLVLILLYDFLGNTFPFQLCDQIALHCRILWFCDDLFRKY